MVEVVVADLCSFEDTVAHSFVGYEEDVVDVADVAGIADYAVDC